MIKPAMIIGQAQRPETRDAPFQKSNLWKWFDGIGWTQEEILQIFHFDALVDRGTPKGKKGRVPPKPEDIKNYLPQLVMTIDETQPELIVPVGGLAVQYILAQKTELRDVIGQRIVAKPFGMAQRETVIISLPHPSGVSLWLNSAHHRNLLGDALVLLKDELNKFLSMRLQ